MANYATLKAAIQAAIKQNGNNEITGNLLQAQLLSMINSLGDGYQFKGVATPVTNPGTPDNKVFYIAGIPGTYTNFNNIVVKNNSVVVLKYDSVWSAEETNAASVDSIGSQEIRFNVVAGQSHSSTRDQINVNIKSGEKFTVKNTSTSYTGNDVYLFAYTSDGTGSELGRLAYGSERTFVASNDIAKLGVYVEGNVSGVVSLMVTYSFAEMAKDAYTQLTNIRANLMSISDGLSGSQYNLIHDKAAKKVTITAGGIRLYLVGKQINLAGPFDMVYTDNQNGAWVIDKSVIENAANDSVITLTSSNVMFANTNTTSIKNNIILFPVYFGRLIYSGVLGVLLLASDTAKDDIFPAIISAVDGFGGATRNIVVDRSTKKVRIKKEGFRLVFNNRQFGVSGDSDFEMGFDSATYPNGGWFLKRSVIMQTANKGTIALSSDNIYYAGVTSENYANGDYLLFATYYDYIPPVGLLGTFVADVVTPAMMQANAFNSAYNDIDITDKCKQFSALINNSGIAETFIFMTDPHLLHYGNGFDENLFKTYIGLLLKYYNMLPVDWMICGGDWLNERDYQDVACWKLGYMDATMRKLFKNYYPVLGNHDTNYQGVVSALDSSRGDLTHRTLINLMFRENKNTYYEWLGNNTRFFVFDTQTDWESAMDAFKWTQINWFAESLLTNRDPHIIVLQHIYYSSGTSIAPMSTNIQAICGAFNRRGSITLNGITYNFSGATGKIHCIIAGHNHTDVIDTAGNVPVWLTTNMRDGNTPTFDLMLVDYTAGKLKSVRVGTGSNREMTLA